MQCLVSGKKLILVSFYEHIGDIVACEPIIPYLKSKYSNTFIVWFTDEKYTELLQVHPQLNKIWGLKTYSDWVVLNQIFKHIPFVSGKLYDLNIDNRRCSVYGRKIKRKIKRPAIQTDFSKHNLLYSFTVNAGLEPLTEAAKFYLNSNNDSLKISAKYIVLHTSSNSNLKDWQQQNWQQLSIKLIEDGYHVAEIGLHKQIDIFNSQYHDFTGKKSLQALSNLINNSFFFIGLDSGFAHIASALNKNGLVLIADYSDFGFQFKSFNPYSGLYANGAHILYAHEGLLASTSTDKVIDKFHELVHE